MQTHQFTIHTTQPVDDSLEAMVERIYGRCDDASAHGHTSGKLCVSFDRDASNIDIAMRSAIADLRSVGCGIEKIVIDTNELETLTAESV